MSRWPSVKHFCSWLGLSPQHKISGGKVLSRHVRPGAHRVAVALRLAARTVQQARTALGAFYRRHAQPPGRPQGHHGDGAQARPAGLQPVKTRQRLCQAGPRGLREPVPRTHKSRPWPAKPKPWGTPWSNWPSPRRRSTTPSPQQPRKTVQHDAAMLLAPWGKGGSVSALRQSARRQPPEPPPTTPAHPAVAPPSPR